MVISHKFRFIYFGPRRTGSTSLSKYFVDNFEAVYDYRQEFDRYPNRCLTDTGRAQHQIYLPAEFDDYLTILSVRNPYTRFRSMYSMFGCRHDCQDMIDYIPFAEPPITEELAETRIDHLIRNESFVSDIQALPFLSRQFEIPHERNLPTAVPLPELVVQFVKHFYRDDFNRFGYSHEVPKQLLRN